MDNDHLRQLVTEFASHEPCVVFMLPDRPDPLEVPLEGGHPTDIFALAIIQGIECDAVLVVSTGTATRLDSGDTHRVCVTMGVSRDASIVMVFHDDGVHINNDPQGELAESARLLLAAA